MRALVLLATVAALAAPMAAGAAEGCGPTATVRCVRFCWDQRLDPAEAVAYASDLVTCLT